MTLLLSVVLFAVTLVLIIWRPGGHNEALYAAPGALLLLATGLLAMEDAAYIWHIVWNATLSLIGIMILTATMDDNGFFRWAALHIVRRTHGKRLLLMAGLAAFSCLISTFFNNDGTVLIMTPIVLEVTALIGMGIRARIAFLLSVGLMADTASATLMVSNLTNILTADYFGMSFGDYARNMLFPGVTASMATIGVLLLTFGKTIRKDVSLSAKSKHDFPLPASVIRNSLIFRLSWVVLTLILIGYFCSEALDLPVSFIACGGALLLWGAGAATGSADSVSIVRRTPWLIVVFALSMNLIVYNLYLRGAADGFSDLLVPVSESGLAGMIFGSGALFSLLAAIMNNLPAVLISSLSISGLEHGGYVLPFASLIGMSVGAKLTPIGSLATMLWLELLRREGVRISWGQYMKIGFVLTVPILFVALGAMWLQFRL
ncbi:arsenical efflux pump membrane protein ArsB [Cohnella endophytica]|uniref:Arsenical efflux pump membrane protein ArsB n=1 Tax=Cohnella endophytica TaxID=2419778 RepID=A0A494XZ34_9BACL|nr:ArsB/NhaD family transporter [Cohnella endophytica]RKP54329.1 arsenical efflux pump membrane protein ArsB [Cohnella endophytica]